jgi:PKHD-type hydroxylase
LGEKEMMIDPLYWSWQAEIPASVCDAIITEGLKLPIQEATVGDQNQFIVNPDIRKSKVGFFPCNSWVGAIAWHYMCRANAQAWKFNVTHQQDPQFTVYENDQFYDFHQDASVIESNMRKLSLVISITDPDKYQGGVFEFEDGTQPDIRRQGSILVFPSFLKHRVAPVTSGTRYSLVNWFTGAQFT